MKLFPMYPSSEVDRQTMRGISVVLWLCVCRVHTGGVRRTLERDFGETLESA